MKKKFSHTQTKCNVNRYHHFQIDIVMINKQKFSFYLKDFHDDIIIMSMDKYLPFSHTHQDEDEDSQGFLKIDDRCH